jgi:hypothetical protein
MLSSSWMSMNDHKPCALQNLYLVPPYQAHLTPKLFTALIRKYKYL